MSATEEPITKNILIRDVPLPIYLKAIEIKERLGCENWNDLLNLAIKSLEGGMSSG